MTLENIADEIYTELDSPTSLTLAGISYWLQRNLGIINDLLGTCFSIDNSLNVAPDLTLEEKVIFKKMYFIHYYDKMIRSNLSAASLNPVIEIDSDGSKVRKISKNEISKTYLQIRKQEQEELKDLINSYKDFKSYPRQIVGDEVITNQYTDSTTNFSRGI